MQRTGRPVESSEPPGEPAVARGPGGVRPFHLTLLLGGLLALVTVATFWPVGRCEFVRYDDQEYVTENPTVRAGLTWRGLAWAFTTFHAGNWHPVTWLSHMLDCQLYGLNPTGHHWTNLLLHVANTLLLFGVLRRLTGARWRSAFVAALFALHPLHVESVAWVAERKDVLSTFFLLLTLGTYGRYVSAVRRRHCERSRRREPAEAAIGQDRPPTHVGGYATVHAFNRPAFNYALSLGFFALGLMSKPMLVTGPFLLLLLDYWPLRRLELSTLSLSFARRLLWEKLPFFLLSAASSFITIRAQRSGGAIVPTELLPVVGRLGNALVAYSRYLFKTVWPQDLAVLYPLRVSLPLWQVAGAGLLLAAVTVLVVRATRRRPYLPVGWFWYLGTLVPVIGLLQVGGQALADRYTYVPLIGVFVMLAWGAADFTARWPGFARALWPMGLVILFACAGATRQQLRHWQNSESLFRQALRATQNNFVMHHNLARVVTNRVEKLHHLEAAVRLHPGYAEAHHDLGLALAADGRLEEAIGHYREALRFQPKYLDARNNLGVALKQAGRLPEAVEQFEAALALDPDSETARVNLGGALLSQGRIAEALAHLQRALQSHTNSAAARNALGAALDAQGQHAEALQHYRTAIRLKPDDADAHNNLGAALLDQGKLDEAQKHLQEAIRLNSGSADAYGNLAILALKQGRKAEATQWFAAAARRRPESAQTHYQLGLLLAEQGQTAEALRHLREAVRLAPGSAPALNELAWRLATHPDARFRNGSEAAALAARAVELTRTNNAAVLDTLAAAQAEAGRFPEAVKTAQDALKAAEGEGRTDLAAQIRQHLQLYQSRQPLRE